MLQTYVANAAKSVPTTLLAVLFTMVAACGDSTAPVGAGSATLTVLLTDAPGNVDQVWVQVQEAYLQGGPSGRVTVLPFDDSRDMVELTSLAGTAMTLAQDVQLDPQTVSQFRLVIGEAAIVTTGGEIYSKDGGLPPGAISTDVAGTLACPSCSQSGLKINLPDGTLAFDAGSNEVVVDFDAGQSLAHEAGNSGRWVMRPVINGMDTDESGSIQAALELPPGIVVPECPPGQPRSLSDLRIIGVSETLRNADGDPIRVSGTSDSSGNFRITWVPTDRYQLEPGETLYDGPRLGFSVSSPQSVVVSAGNTTQVNYSVSGITCQL